MRKRFLLVGNGPHANRGCEAIVRGTAAILRREFGEDTEFVSASFADDEAIARQQKRETDAGIRHYGLRVIRPPRWRRRLCRLMGHEPSSHVVIAPEALSGIAAALQIGGDNYTLDYGRPTGFVEVDRFLQKQGIPVVLWGASVGPFDSEPRFADEMFGHLRSMSGIIVRESISRDYLRNHGVGGNLHEACDPAFAMEAMKPDENRVGFAIPEGAVGLNLNALLAKYVCGGDNEEWVNRCADIVRRMIEVAGRHVALFPHVESKDPRNDDYALARRVADAVSSAATGRVCVAENNLSAAEVKWLVARCDAFAGGRMHSTVAAMSSGVPTISLAYSIKAKGLHSLVFGDNGYCLTLDQLTPEVLAERMCSILADAPAIRQHLQKRAPELVESAYSAGAILRKII